MIEEIEVSGMGELRDRVGRLETGLAENTATTKRIETSTLKNEKDTMEMLELFRNARGGFKVLGVVGQVFKWVVAVAASVTALWLSLKGK
jgi:hypothetical protein